MIFCPKIDYPLPFVSIIIPTLNESESITSLCDFFDRIEEPHFEVIISDSPDSTEDIKFVDEKKYLTIFKSTQSGRAFQMNEGAKKAQGSILVFLHADVRPPITMIEDIRNGVENGYPFGFFSYRFEPSSFMLDFNASFTKRDGIFAGGGDQIHFMAREIFDKMNGYDTSFSIMEDFDFVRRYRKIGLPLKVITKDAVVSSRKYSKNSWLKVNILNLIAFIMFNLGFNSDTIKKMYYSNLTSPKGK